jgi:hypothetical protein
MAITSKEINLAQLDQETGGKGLICNFNDPKKKIVSPADNSDVTESQLEAAIAAHVALPKPELTVEDKLASVGLSIADLKAALSV